MRADLVLAAVAIALGVLAACAYAAFRAVSDGGARAFGEAMLFPGPLVIAAIAAVVWLGWNANID